MATGRVSRILEILLVFGTFAGASTLGTLAVLGEPKPGAEGVVPFGNQSGLRTRGEIAACLTSKASEIIAPEIPTPADATALAAILPGGDIAVVVVFGSQAAADGYHDEFTDLQPPGGLVIDFGHVLLAYPVTPDPATRADVESCVLGDDVGPIDPPALVPLDPDSNTGDVLADCLIETNLGFEWEDITDIHPDATRALRVTQGDMLLFIFLFDSEAKADEFQEVYGPDQVVHDLGRGVVEYEREPEPPLEAAVEGCVEAAIA